MLEGHIIKITQAIEAQAIDEMFEYFLQVGLIISNDQLRKYQQQKDIDTKVLSLDQIIKYYSSKIAYKYQKISKNYPLYIAAFYEQISERYRLAVESENSFYVKTLFAPLKIGLMLYQRIHNIELSESLYRDEKFNVLTQEINQLINKKLQFNDALNHSGLNPIACEYHHCDANQLKNFSSLVEQVEVMSENLQKQLTSMGQCELLQMIYRYKNLLYPLFSYHCISAETEDDKFGVSASITSLNQWFQSAFSDYKQFQWLYFPHLPFYQVHGATKLFNQSNKTISNSLALS
ncbi:MAG: hypothetical protein EP298_05695 [Gammaproteobacteria bacterium]|nr:MAG: hypothetical protein EP298_05695 [Gammaproteobacteria bacterium]UTW42768.1 hypothetical protein KFE69_01060 [bacterium SCSIO 12844]